MESEQKEKEEQSKVVVNKVEIKESRLSSLTENIWVKVIGLAIGLIILKLLVIKFNIFPLAFEMVFDIVFLAIGFVLIKHFAPNQYDWIKKLVMPVIVLLVGYNLWIMYITHDSQLQNSTYSGYKKYLIYFPGEIFGSKDAEQSVTKQEFDLKADQEIAKHFKAEEENLLNQLKNNEITPEQYIALRTALLKKYENIRNTSNRKNNSGFNWTSQNQPNTSTQVQSVQFMPAELLLVQQIHIPADVPESRSFRLDSGTYRISVDGTVTYDEFPSDLKFDRFVTRGRLGGQQAVNAVGSSNAFPANSGFNEGELMLVTKNEYNHIIDSLNRDQVAADITADGVQEFKLKINFSPAMQKTARGGFNVKIFKIKTS